MVQWKLGGVGATVLPRRRAAAAAELALLLPLLVTIALGCVDFGRIFYMNIAVANAARVGAGVASFSPVSAGSWTNWENAIRAAVTEELAQQTGFDPDRLTVATPVITTEGAGFSRVRVQVRYRFSMIINWVLLPNEVELGHAVEMAVIR
jgi:Flp pilus assembly protein TadG